MSGNRRRASLQRVAGKLSFDATIPACSGIADLDTLFYLSVLV
jgi:hypothetical protein